MIYSKFFSSAVVAVRLALGMKHDAVYAYYFGNSCFGYISLISFFWDEVLYRQSREGVIEAGSTIALIGRYPSGELPHNALSARTRGLIWMLGRSIRGRWDSVSSLGEAAPIGEFDYLSVICTARRRRGHGDGTRLLEKLQADQRSIYLETASFRNLDWYSRCGFTVTGVQDLPSGPKIWTMMWQPRVGA
jgi:GNAT superfamily N-acetyltransferase